MINSRFPDQISESIGYFWLLGQDESEHTSGTVVIVDEVANLELLSSLTPWDMTIVNSGGQTVNVAQEESTGLVIHGRLPQQGPLVSLVDATTSGRHRVIGGRDKVPEKHFLEASWCLSGLHSTGIDQHYPKFQVRVFNLDDWASLEELSMTRLKTGGSIWNYTPMEAIETTSQSAKYAVRLISQGFSGAPTAKGFNLRRECWLEFESDAGWTLPDITGRICASLETLFVTLTGKSSPVLSLRVNDGERWASVHGLGVTSGSPKKGGEMLLTREETGLEVVVGWLDKGEVLGAAPAILATALSGGYDFVQSEALALTTALESLHRRLYPDDKQFTEDNIKDARAALVDSGMPTVILESLDNALRLYWNQPSYPQRLVKLSELVSEVAPDCIGRINKWKAEVSSARNAQAHGLEEIADGNEFILKMASLNKSIRWALRIIFLRQAGISADSMVDALKNHRRYELDRAQWREHLPKVYPMSRN